MERTPGAATREYRLASELDPADHPAIGEEGGHLLLFRVHLLGRDHEGAEQIREQRVITVDWLDPSHLLEAGSAARALPLPLRRALTTMLNAEEKPKCETCRMRYELDRLLAVDRVWELTEGPGPEPEEIRWLVVQRELAGIPGQDVFLRWHQHHDHQDIGEQLAAARQRHQARVSADEPTTATTATSQALPLPRHLS